MGGDDGRRTSMWLYYDRRVAFRQPGSSNVFDYFVGLGVDANLETINSELREISRCLGQLTATSFLDVGAGPHGTFTLQLPGRGSALDQSIAALRRLRAVAADLPLVRADGIRLPIRNKAVGRVFISHLHGLLLPDERAVLLAEACRAGDEIVILDSGCPSGARVEEWQTRTLPDGSTYPIYRRHLDVETLLGEVGGEVLFGGEYFVMTHTRPSG